MGKPAGRRNWDVEQAQEVTLVEAIATLGETSAACGRDLQALSTDSEEKKLLGTTDQQRAIAALARAAKGRDDFEYWTRVLVELSVRAGVSQREVARKLGITAQTVARWVSEPVGFDWPEEED